MPEQDLAALAPAPLGARLRDAGQRGRRLGDFGSCRAVLERHERDPHRARGARVDAEQPVAPARRGRRVRPRDLDGRGRVAVRLRSAAAEVQIRLNRVRTRCRPDVFDLRHAAWIGQHAAGFRIGRADRVDDSTVGVGGAGGVGCREANGRGLLHGVRLRRGRDGQGARDLSTAEDRVARVLPRFQRFAEVIVPAHAGPVVERIRIDVVVEHGRFATGAAHGRPDAPVGRARRRAASFDFRHRIPAAGLIVAPLRRRQWSLDEAAECADRFVGASDHAWRTRREDAACELASAAQQIAGVDRVKSQRRRRRGAQPGNRFAGHVLDVEGRAELRFAVDVARRLFDQRVVVFRSLRRVADLEAREQLVGVRRRAAAAHRALMHSRVLPRQPGPPNPLEAEHLLLQERRIARFGKAQEEAAVAGGRAGGVEVAADAGIARLALTERRHRHAQRAARQGQGRGPRRAGRHREEGDRGQRQTAPDRPRPLIRT
jgi:hypothetical protein